MFEYLIKKLPVPTTRVTVILLDIKSCNALLCMPLECTRSYPKSVLRYKFLILDMTTYYLDSPNLRDPVCEEP